MILLNPPTFPTVIDNTIRSAYRKCPAFAGMAYFLGLQPPEESVHLHAGGAYASGLEALRKSFYEQGKSADEAILDGTIALILAYGEFDSGESAKSWLGMVSALHSYVERFPLETDYLKPIQLGDGRSGIEFTFAIPLPIAHPLTGDPLLYGGRTDMLCEYRHSLYIEDDKTASMLGAQWRNQWDLDSQMTGYCFAAQEFEIPVVGAIIRGTSITSAGNHSHEEVVTMRARWEIDRWYEELLADVEQMIEDFSSGRFSQTLDKSACAAYGGCLFRKPCSSRDPSAWLGEFVERRWNPLTPGL